MAQDEHTSKCSNNNNTGGGSSSHRSTSKKPKHKKVPQRGMGVAQLEKIISEEHQKKDAIISPSNSSNLNNIQKIPNFNAIPPPPPLPVSKTDGGKVSKTSGVGVGVGGGGNWSRIWSDGEYKFDGDHSRYTASFPANLGGLPYESSPPIWAPSPNLMMQRSQSLVNVSANTASSCSSPVLNFQIELPSNQSYCGNNFQSLWPEEEKMVGMKRPYPFSLENMPIPSFHCKFPSAYVSRSDEYASCSNGGTASIDPAHPVFRETCSSSGAISDPITKKFIDENHILTRDFLKLAPPQTNHSRSSSKESIHLSPCRAEQPQFERLTLQKDQSKEPIHLTGRSVSNPQPFLSFFPAAKTPMGQPGNGNGDAGESVDLNLKL
ncbi:uncharacterized protein LOC143531042 [Bidens hawaiensis]|uniref:uncharacterized protein LOC143531042 n=1 Tax=Bidens hawaiensis TaxID=980011 RepID=UPI00404A66E0